VLAEFGLFEAPSAARGEELELHAVLQRGRFEEGRGILLAAALKHLRQQGLRCEVLHDGARAQTLAAKVTSENSAFRFGLLSDLGSPPPRPLILARDLGSGDALLLVEACHGYGRLPLHVLLVRRAGDDVAVMNSDTGANHRYTSGELQRHLTCPVTFGATAFASRLYLFTGIAVLLRFNAFSSRKEVLNEPVHTASD
jgi:hypothetical protein